MDDDTRWPVSFAGRGSSEQEQIFHAVFSCDLVDAKFAQNEEKLPYQYQLSKLS